jgi:hypothetical protein
MDLLGVKNPIFYITLQLCLLILPGLGFEPKTSRVAGRRCHLTQEGSFESEAGSLIDCDEIFALKGGFCSP